MRTHTQKIIAAMVLTLTLVSSSRASAADEQAFRPCMLVGDTETAWVILFDKGGTEYKLAARQAGDKEKWKSVGTDRTGSIVAATSDGASLVVFFSNGENMRYFPHRAQGQPGTKPPDDLFGKDAQILASAPAADDSNAVIVLVVRPIRLPPQTQPAVPIVSTQPAKLGELVLLQCTSQKWRQVAVVPNKLIKSATRAHVAVHKNTIYVLAEWPKRSLLIFEAGKWRQRIDLPDLPDRSQPMAIMIIEDALVLAEFDTDDGVVNLARFASDKWQPIQPVRRDGKNLTWPADAPPVIARFADKAAMLWKTDKKWLFTTCKPDGQADDESPMNAFTWADEQEQIERMQNIFFMVVFGLIVVLMFWPGQPLRTAPFSLPATIPPAKLARRFAAACVDALPFLFIATAIGAKDLDTTTVATFEQAKQAVSTTRFLYAFWGFLVVYPAYCFVMEYRFGATVGKMILRLRVVADKGRKPLLRELALRNVSKAIEILGLVMIFPLLFPLLTRYRQRLGDKIAWTTVIDAETSRPIAPQDNSDADRSATKET